SRGTDHARQRIEEELDPLYADTGKKGRFFVEADRDHGPAQRRGMQDYAEDDCQDQKDAQSPGELGVRYGVRAHRLVSVGEPANRAAAQDDLGNTSVERQRADSDGQGRQAETGHQDPVETSRDDAHQQDGDDGYGQGPPVLEKITKERRGEAEGRGYR